MFCASEHTAHGLCSCQKGWRHDIHDSQSWMQQQNLGTQHCKVSSSHRLGSQYHSSMQQASPHWTRPGWCLQETLTLDQWRDTRGREALGGARVLTRGAIYGQRNSSLFSPLHMIQGSKCSIQLYAAAFPVASSSGFPPCSCSRGWSTWGPMLC
ncbi:hypothetical protein ABBQ32_012946 [Trebouxia sp. C0010 RCD-2024]